jgi:hypothetical protein
MPGLEPSYTEFYVRTMVVVKKCLLEYNTMLPTKSQLTFRRNMSFISSGLKSKLG